MKLKLGAKSINPRRISNVFRVSAKVARIVMITGKSIIVACEVHVPTQNTYSYTGSVQNLKEFVENHKRLDAGF